MDPAYRSTISSQKERSKKRSNTNTDISRMIEEERESKRNRLSQHTGGESMYAQTPPGLYQQHITEPDYDQIDHYADNDSMAGSSQQYTPVERPLSNAQQKTQDRQQQYHKLVSGLGESMLAPRPVFQEESDSGGDGGSDEAESQDEDVGYRSSPQFVNNSDDTRVSQANFPAGQQYSNRETQNSLADDTFRIYRGDQQSHFAQTRETRSDQNYSYIGPTREQLPHEMRSQFEGVNNQYQPTTSHRPRLNLLHTTQKQHVSVPTREQLPYKMPSQIEGASSQYQPSTSHRPRSNLPDTSQKQHGSGDRQAGDSRGFPRENPRLDFRQVPEIPSAGRATNQQPQTSHEYANHQPRPSGVSPTPMGNIRPRRSMKVPVEGYTAPKNILDTVKPRKSNTEKARRGQFKEDLVDPARTAASASPVYNTPAASFAPAAPISPIAPIIPISQPIARHYASQPDLSSGSTTSSSVRELSGRIPEEQLLNFVPDDLDNRVWEYRHRKEPLDWPQIKEILDYSGTVYVLENLKTRQRFYEAKRKLEKQKKEATIEEEVVRQVMEPIRAELMGPATTTAQPVIPPSIIQADTRRLSDTLEEERVVWATKEAKFREKEAEFQERVKALEDESAAKTAELKAQEKQLKLKDEVQAKYQKLKEEAQTQKENLKDEKALRIKAERDLKAAQSEAHRRALAAAGAARNKGRATDTGFTFSNDDEEAEDENLQRKTPAKRSKSRKPNPSTNLRDDGHPQTAGKSLPPAAIQALYKHLNRCKDEDEEDTEEPPETIQEEELSYFVYTVYRKQWLIDEEEPDNETKIGCGDYTYLNEANVAVTNEILRPYGNASAIKIDPKQERSLHQGMDEHDMSWAQLDVPAGHVRVWVQRQLHTEFQGKLPLFENKGILHKKVFAVRQEISTSASNSTSGTEAPTLTTIIQEDDEIYTTFGLANIKANEKVFKLLWPEDVEGSARKTTLSAVKAKEEARQERKQRVEDLEDQGQLFTEEVDRKDGTKVKIFVVQKTVTGPRN
jgi:hypothetical protein